MAANPAFVALIRTPAAAIANPDAQAFKTLMAAGANGSRVEATFVSNTDPSNAYIVQVAIQIGGTDYPIGEVSIGAGAGTNGSTPGTSLLAAFPSMPTKNGELYLEAGSALRVRTKTTVAGGNRLGFVVQGGDY